MNADFHVLAVGCPSDMLTQARFEIANARFHMGHISDMWSQHSCTTGAISNESPPERATRRCSWAAPGNVCLTARGTACVSRHPADRMPR
jgi:hypothetical protein